MKQLKATFLEGKSPTLIIKKPEDLEQQSSEFFGNCAIAWARFPQKWPFTCSRLTIETIIYEICLKLTIKTPEQSQWHCFGVFILTLDKFHTFF